MELLAGTVEFTVYEHASMGKKVVMPIAHGEGCYVAEDAHLDELEAEDRVAFRYVDNPNGSMRDIAGILNRERNVHGHDAASGARLRTR